MTRRAPSRPQARLHRSTVLVLLVAVIGTVTSTVVTRGLVRQSEQRLLEQKAGAAAVVMSSLIGQYYGGAAQAVAATATPGGDVQATAFAGTAAALRAAKPTSASTQGGLGASAVAVLNLSTGTVVASSGTLVLDVHSPGAVSMVRSAAQAAAADPNHVAFVGLLQGGHNRVLALLSPAAATTVGYLEVPVDSTPQTTGTESSPLLNQAFGHLDYAIHFGSDSPGSLIWTSRKGGRLSGHVARVYVGASITTSFASASYDPQRRPLMISISAREPLTGTFAQQFPWLLLGFGLISGFAVMVLTEKTQRGKDRAYSLVGQLEARNAEVEEAVQRRLEAEEQLRQSQRLEAVGQLAGGIAHDFNNLLAVMFSYLGFLRTEGQGQPWLEDVDEVDKAARRAAELTQQLLMFSRRDVARQEVLDLRTLLADRARLLQRTLSDDIDVTLDIPDHPLPVCADAVELDQVLMNLAVNARDAMTDGGTLTLALDETREGEARLVRLRVCDTGAGMAEEVREHAFEPFFTTKEVGRGTGLGLATVYGIVTRAGGSVELASVPGHGTTVTVLLPRSQDPLQRVLEQHPMHKAEGGSGTVLLVEDEEAVRRATARILRESGYDVIEASDGPQALALFAEKEVDMVVTDVVMPGGISGSELAARLRRQRPDLPVVLASGYGGDHLSRCGPLPDGTQLLSKPFVASTLIDAVRRGLESQGASA